MPEEEAFAVLVQIMQQHRMRDMFKPSMAELGVCMYQLENLVQEQFPELHVHFQTQGFQTSMYASRWFLTLFTVTLNLSISCRVMDIFLSEGMEFIFKMALAMLVIGKESLLSLDMEAMLKVQTPSRNSPIHVRILIRPCISFQFFQKDLPERVQNDPENLFNIAFTIKINTKKMKKLEKEYADVRKKEQEEMGELRVSEMSETSSTPEKVFLISPLTLQRLRNENRLLKKQNELLEAESTELAHRLVRGQVSRAEEEETAFAIQSELLALRKSHLELSHQLENANEEVRGLSLRLQENVSISIQSSHRSLLTKFIQKP